jgi:hypothetical protein
MQMGGWIAARSAGLMLCAGLAGCATGTAGSKPAGELTVTKETWAYYQQYLRDIGTTSAGAFAVSADGGSAFYFYCPDVACVNRANYKQRALKGCESFGRDCVIFAYGADIVVKYRVEG